jgi:hypothetical protein
LDDIIKNGDPKRRAEAARKISELFWGGAAQFRPAHADLFDGILTGLVPHTEIAARADLAERLARLNFERLAASTARRVLSFWQTLQSA